MNRLCEGLGAALVLAIASCGPKTGELSAGSKAPAGPRASSSARFVPAVGNFATVEVLQVAQGSLSPAADLLVNESLPRIRSNGGVRDCWFLRNDEGSQLLIVSIWADPVDFQRWQMSRDRLDAYQPLGPMLTAPPSAQPVSLIGLISRGGS